MHIIFMKDNSKFSASSNRAICAMFIELNAENNCVSASSGSIFLSCMSLAVSNKVLIGELRYY